MSSRVSLAESAVRDLEAVREWYVSQSAPDVGERLVREVLASLDQLIEFPESGRVVPSLSSPGCASSSGRRSVSSTGWTATVSASFGCGGVRG